MTLNIGSSLAGGIRRVVSRNGVLLLAIYTAVGIVWQFMFNSLVVSWLRGTEFPVAEMTLPTVDAPFGLLVAGGVLSLLALSYLNILAIRVFVNDDRSSIPSEFYTRNIVLAIVNTFIGGIVYGILVFVGSIFLFIPGIIAYVAFIFMPLYVAVEDENFIAALRDSWGLTRGHWLRLFGLLVIMFIGIFIVALVLAIVLTLVVAAVGNETLVTLVSTAIYLPLGLFTLGILADAFDQLRSESDADTEAVSTS